MARFTKIQTNFTGGEWSPRLYGRVDLEKYGDSCRAMLNAVVHPHGGWTRRPGTLMAANTKSNLAVREVKFDYSDIASYKLEFTNNKMRVFKEHALIESSPGTPLEVSTVYPTSVLDELYFLQSNDVMYIFHETYPTKKLTRTSDTSWTFTDVDWLDGPYLDPNLTTPIAAHSTATMTPSHTSGTSRTITASAPTFVASDVGRYIRLNRLGIWGYAKITGYTSSTQVTVDIKKDFKDTTATSEWRMSAIGSALGYPNVGEIHEGRMVIALGQDIWGSISGDLETFSPTSDKTTVNSDGTTTTQSVVADGDSYHFLISPDQVTNIRWMVSSTVLFIGTQGSEFIMRASSTEAGITPSNVQVVKISSYGSARIQPVKTVDAAIFVQRFRRKIMELTYDPDELRYKVSELTLFSEHITKTGVTCLTYQQEPNSIVWAARDDGAFIGLTYNRDQNVFAFHRHQLGTLADGSFPLVESVCCIPNNTTGEDELWLTAKVNTNRYACYMREYFNTNLGHTKEDAFFVDLGALYDGTATNTITVGAHLEGETVVALADGAVKKDLEVTSGDITLDRNASKVAAGLAYRTLVTTLSLEAGQTEGTAQGKNKKLTSVRLQVYDSLGGMAGPDEEHAEMIEFTDGDTQPVMDSTTPLYSGTTQPIDWPGDWDEEMTLTVFTDEPLPLTVLTLIPRGVTMEGGY